ncbi:glycosyltransferase [Candidatus Bathyarchaeota archaeon]|nr:glycosyltransferase [Candidatus Bathyarchaeota archaeon]
MNALKVALPGKEISIVLPAYNEALRIEKCAREVERAVSSFSSSYEIIVAEDGSTDGTHRIAASLSESNSHLSFLHSPVRLGKGKAIKNALRSARGDIIVFMDVDLSANLNALPHIVQIAKQQRGLAIGSRHVKGSRVQRPFTRTLFSLTYNLFARMMFLDGIRDHQCGFKAMSHEVAEVIRDSVKSDGFFLDTEMILQCKRRGFPVVEVKVEWSENKKRSESVIKPLHDAAKMGIDLLRFRLNRNG